jgi:hypothetical protein
MVIRLDENYNAMTSTALLGYVGETNARPVSVEGMEIDGADRYVLTIDYGDGVQYEVDITGGQWTPTADILRSAQTVSCQIAAKKLSGQEYILVKKSRIFRLRIGAAIGDTAIPSPDVAVDALDRIDAISRHTHADMQKAVTAAETATTAAENAKKSATAAEKSADTATQAASRAETVKTAAETSATQAETAMQGAETARAEAVKSQNSAKVSAAQASASAQQTEADKNITAGYAKTAKTCADSTTADGQAVQTLAEQVTADKATVADHAAQVAEDRTAAETAAQTAQAVADSLPEDYTTAVGKIAENTSEIASVKLSDKELKRRVDALYDIGQGITHKFETDSSTAYAKIIPTGAKLMSVKSVGGRSIVFNQMIPDSIIHVTVTIDEDVTEDKWISRIEADTSNIISAHGHKVLGKCVKDASNPTANVVVRFGDNNTNISNGYESEHSTEKGIYPLQPSVKNGALYYRAFAGATAGTYKFTLQLFDLTAMFGSENEPTTVEEFEKIFPNDYYQYNAGEIISVGTEEIVEQGKNLWNLESYTASDLVDLKAGYWGVRLSVKPNSAYCVSVIRDTALCGTYGKLIGADKRDIEFFGHKTMSGINAYTGHPITFQTADENYVYVAINSFNGFVTWKSDFLKYFPSFQIEKSSTATAYVPYHSNVYPIPENIRALPGYGWSAGTARNYVDYENKRYVQCVGSVDLGTLTWMKTSSQSVGDYFYAPVSAIGFKRLGAFGITVHNILCSKYITVARNPNAFVDKTIVLDGDSIAVSQIQVKDTAYTDATAFKQAMSGVMLYYELANPIVTDISSLIPDDFLRNIEVEAGGSVTFKNSNDSYRIPVPNEEEYIVKLSEVGGTT